MPTPPEQTFAAYQEHLGRGHQLLARGDAKAALAAYRAAAELADERPLPHVLVGRALLALNRAAEALAAFERALERAAADPSALAGKAEALLRLGRRDDAAAVRQQLDDAAAAATAALAAAAASLPPAEAQALAAERAWQEGRHQAAQAEWLAAARTHAADGHIDAALDACQRALIVDAGAPRVHLEMCRLYIAAGLERQAVERMLLLTRLTELEQLDDVRQALAALAAEHAELDPRLSGLADRLSAPPPA
ncbi:MAG TPA: hypothetical protein VNT28_06315 [Candidatus Limnocylindrales bacterium]|nr:hypothetical protein [Candidatus Limnocylindrales bacterium]